MSMIFKRTHYCGVLRAAECGQEVVLNGWVSKSRRLGSIIFCDLRDKTGITQIVFDDTCDPAVFEKAASLRSEYVIGVKGQVRERSSKNPELPTGDIEVLAKDIIIYSEADTPPIYVKDDDNVDEMLRLKYRYLDLRKPKMQKNLSFRHKIVKLTRDYFDSCGFTEVETPVLINPTPEGARDYLVPSRVHPGEFYALPQSPQLFKQLLMVGGTDRYMQIAKCFRDEDLRADRQPEFTQIDLEMSFVDQEDVLEIQEGYLKRLFKEIMNVDIKLPLPRLTWDEAMERYGSDKPDTRFGFELKKLNDKFANCGFSVFTDALAAGGDIRGICIDGGSKEFSRKDIDKMVENIKHFGAKGLVWIRYNEDGITSSVNKFFDEAALKDVLSVFDAKVGDLVLIVCGKAKVVFDSLGFLRRDLAKKMGLLDPHTYNLLWVTDFPMFELDEETGKWSAMHHPFTHPNPNDYDKLDTDPGAVKAIAYDIVLNGVELGGGSVRISDRNLQARMFDVLGISKEDAQRKFGWLLEAYRYGAPPHAGLAYGLDRLVMLLAGEDSIREVIAFPKNQAAQCMVCQAPSAQDAEALTELCIEVKKPE